MGSGTEHSPLGASGAHRWMVCPGSVALSEGLPNHPSIHAVTGTVAHGIGEDCLRTGQNPVDFIGQSREQNGHQIHVTEEMARAVMLYVDYVRVQAQEPARLHIEAPFRLTRIDPRLWGTSDAVIWQPDRRRLVVIDYKHGSGVRVEVKDNPQLRYYALGALLEHNYPAETVRVVVVQPNIDWDDGEKIRYEDFEATDLINFAAELKAAVNRVDERPNEYVPGEHCTFCPAQAICPALSKQALEVAAQDFAPQKYTPEQIGKLLSLLPQLEKWAAAVREFAYNEANAGRPIPGYKLVDKRGIRVWADEQQAVTAMLAAGLKDDDMYESKLRSPAQIEKTLGKTAFKPVSKHAVLHSSGTTLAPMSDKRPAVDPIAADFKALSHT